jgi:hypothetical protein
MPGFPRTEPTESEQLLVFLAQQRRVLGHAAYGLSDEQARLAPSVSTLSVGGIVKHVAGVETFWTDVVLGRQDPFNVRSDYHEGFRLGADETLAGALERYSAVASETERIVRSLPIDHPVPVPPRCALVPGRHRGLDRSLGAAAPDRRDGSPCRPGRHRARIDRRCDLVRADGGIGELAALAVGQAVATPRLGERTGGFTSWVADGDDRAIYAGRLLGPRRR